MAEVRRLTKVMFKAQDAISLYFPAVAGGATGWEPVNEADAVAAPGKKGWEMWLHESSPGVGIIKIWHKDRPGTTVSVPLTSVRSWEEFWTEPRYADLLKRESVESKARKEAIAEAEKSAKK